MEVPTTSSHAVPTLSLSLQCLFSCLCLCLLSLPTPITLYCTRFEARLLDAFHVHHQKAQIMTVMRSFANWRLVVVLEKSNNTFKDVVISSHHNFAFVFWPYFRIHIHIFASKLPHSSNTTVVFASRHWKRRWWRRKRAFILSPRKLPNSRLRWIDWRRIIRHWEPHSTRTIWKSGAYNTRHVFVFVFAVVVAVVFVFVWVFVFAVVFVFVWDFVLTLSCPCPCHWSLSLLSFSSSLSCHGVEAQQIEG